MNNIFNDKYEVLNIENISYAFFIIASIIDLKANENLKNFYLKNEKPNEDLRNEYIFASSLILTVFIVFMIRNHYNLSKITKNENEYNYAYIRFIGSLLIVIGQILVLYYFYNTTNFS